MTLSNSRLAVLPIILAAISPLLHAATPEWRMEYPINKAGSEIEINGKLDEPAWQRATVIPLPFEYQPGDNVSPPVQTECLVTYDEANFYVAFRAHDPNPTRIRAHLMDRDTIDTFVQDDHVGFMISPFNDQRRAFQFRVNPLGIQADAIFSELEGIEDFSWDIIWNSAGEITADGYVLEVAIPFNQIRFPRAGAAQTWGFEAFRSWPRNVRHRISSHKVDRNKSCVLCQTNRLTGLNGITPGRNLEFDPTVTADRTDRRDQFPTGPWRSDDRGVEPGLTARWGVTPNMTLNGTLNPDFSQVEADVAQLDVNTRFALFFPEKRPFFLEGVDFFSTPLNTVFTRTVVDPIWGAKLTGKEGKNGVGVFLTRDEVNNLILPSNQGSAFAQLDLDTTGSVVRYRRDVFSRSTLGFLYAGREGTEYHNRLYGVDGFLGITQSDNIRYQLVRSVTQYPQDLALDASQPEDAFSGNGILFNYNHFSRNWFWEANYEDLDPEFRADSGFIPRVDVRTLSGNFGKRIFGSGQQWFTAMNFGVNASRTEDHDGLLTDREIQGFANVSGPLQSFAEYAFGRNKEFFAGVTYDLSVQNVTFQIKPSGDLNFTFFGEFGDAIDFTNAQAADRVFLNPGVEWKLGRSLNVQFRLLSERLDVAGGRLFTVNLSELRLVYQFTSRMFARAILQYEDVERNPALFQVPVDAETRTLFSQFLFSYKINPQTVLFVGYSDNRLGLERTNLAQTDRTFFLKVGYAWLF